MSPDNQPATDQWFEKERRIYDRLISGWLQNHKRQYVVIHGDEVLGFRPDYAAAVELGMQKADIGEFLVKRVQSPDAVEWVSHIERD